MLATQFGACVSVGVSLTSDRTSFARPTHSHTGRASCRHQVHSARPSNVARPVEFIGAQSRERDTNSGPRDLRLWSVCVGPSGFELAISRILVDGLWARLSPGRRRARPGLFESLHHTRQKGPALFQSRASPTAAAAAPIGPPPLC